ncbi:alpha/beta hydrolase [Streptomyces tateyamensis]|uniref:Alpha/beta hydrolase n=1 Tax=Streptomyces tateyamensis TaxID=565073 RepID=A0A2V4NHE2_9ACTN|nr:alpha/beta hydrolase [Streptomyces tateyamensis]PYC84361.1 alpha/beta hydrolase [Streptomyces tateyamensis]
MGVEEFTVAVPGGALAALRWPALEAGAPTVVALHGITANALAWGAVARELAGRVTLVAPDLRGRARSAVLPGPYGLARHAEDAALLLGAMAEGPVLLAGHSMGAWVAALTAVRHPALVSRLLLVDGGVSFPLPPGAGSDQALAAVLGPALDRLSMTFPDFAGYLDFWQRHPAWPSLDRSTVLPYLERDLAGSAPRLRSACVRAAVEADGAEVLLDQEAAAAVHRLPCPAELLWAERGLQDEPRGLYDEARLAGVQPAHRQVPDTNHYSVLMGAAGARSVAEHLLAAAGAG